MNYNQYELDKARRRDMQHQAEQHNLAYQTQENVSDEPVYNRVLQALKHLLPAQTTQTLSTSTQQMKRVEHA